MLTARAFWTTRRNSGLPARPGPPPCAAMVMSLPSRANCFAIRSQRANIVCFLVSKMRPMLVAPPWHSPLVRGNLVSRLSDSHPDSPALRPPGGVAPPRHSFDYACVGAPGQEPGLLADL